MNETIILYHLSPLNNLESIIKNGIVLQIGLHRQKCTNNKERNSKDLRISLCNQKEIDKWFNNLTEKECI